VYSDEIVRPWFDAVVAEVPGVRVFDVHTHTGANDPDGYRATLDQLLAALDAADATGAAFFTMHEPGGYPPANDRVLAEAEAAGGRLVPFCRVDPHAGAAAEAERCFDAGARGIKLHPRAERFRLAEPEVERAVALAAERGLPVLVHAGRGIPALGRDALALAERHRGVRLILAHAGISDLAWLWRHAPAHPNLFFDTSWWSVDDLLALLCLVPPGQVLLGSDAPYGTPLTSAVTTLRCALAAGLTQEQVRSVAGDQARRLVAGEEPLDLGPAPGADGLEYDVLLGRAHTFLVSALVSMFRGASGEEGIALARLACDVGDDAPQAATCRSILALLDRRDPAGTPDEQPLPATPGAHVPMVAAAIARTPGIALPAL
jgi:uncharacterized protein